MIKEKRGKVEKSDPKKKQSKGQTKVLILKPVHGDANEASE